LEEIPEGEHSDARITTTMRAAAKAKAALYREKFSKYTIMENPKIGKPISGGGSIFNSSGYVLQNDLHF
jgi:hypothetical protein